MIVIKEVQNKKDLKKFVKFPIELYKNNPYFVPGLIQDEIDEFTPEKNDAWSYCEVKQWLAYKDNKIVGRVAAINNLQYNQKMNVKQTRFTRYDFIDDKEVSKALMDKVIEYAKESGSEEVIGPMGFCDLDKQGLLVDGFDQIALYITSYNYKYYIDHIEEQGFEVDAKWVEYKLTMPTEKNDKLEKVASYVQKRYGYSVAPIKNMDQVIELIKQGMHIMNEAYSHIYCYVKLTDKQIEQFAQTLKPLINFDYVCAVLNKEGKMIAYGLVAPSVGKAFQKGKGHLLPLTIFRLMKALKKNDTIDMLGVGVLHEYQNTGANAIVLNHILQACIKNGVKYAETGPELETNVQVQAQWKDFEKEVHKRRACYKISIK